MARREPDDMVVFVRVLTSVVKWGFAAAQRATFGGAGMFLGVGGVLALNDVLTAQQGGDVLGYHTVTMLAVGCGTASAALGLLLDDYVQWRRDANVLSVRRPETVPVAASPKLEEHTSGADVVSAVEEDKRLVREGLNVGGDRASPRVPLDVG
jgi:hypothetical protein